MTAEYWLVAAFGLAIALGLGFFIGRRSAPTQQDVATAHRERDEACAEVDRVRGEVSRHFEESASMFGRLADDYRSFFEHFAQTAQNLGLSEGRARELLRQADPRLVADQSAAASDIGAPAAEENPGAAEAVEEGSEPMGFEAGTAEHAGGEEELAEDTASKTDEGEEAAGRPRES